MSLIRLRALMECELAALSMSRRCRAIAARLLLLLLLLLLRIARCKPNLLVDNFVDNFCQIILPQVAFRPDKHVVRQGAKRVDIDLLIKRLEHFGANVLETLQLDRVRAESFNFDAIGRPAPDAVS